MDRSNQLLKRLTFAMTLVLVLPAALPAQIAVLMSGGFSAAYQELVPEFEKSTGITVTTARGRSPRAMGPPRNRCPASAGSASDIVILSRQGLADLIVEGRIVLGSDVDLASVPMGVGVRAGTPHPDISTVNAFKQALLSAKYIGIQSSPAIYLKTKVFPQLGIADALAGKLSDAGAADVASGVAEMVVLRSVRSCPFGALISSARSPPISSSSKCSPPQW